MKHSLKNQMSFVFLGLVVFTVLGCMLVNAVFLTQYYTYNKQSDLKKTYNILKEADQNDTLASENVKDQLIKIMEKSNIALIVSDVDNNILLTTDRDSALLAYQLVSYQLDRNDEHKKVIKSNDDYEICRSVDPRNNTDYLEMWGYLPSGNAFMVRSPIESIRESAALANRFLIYIGIAVLVISALLVRYFTRRMTKPILELAEVSQKMANLDFEAKYTSGGDDEIGVLGRNFNEMSEKLEKAISGLKTANIELQKDIEHRQAQEHMRTEFLGNVSHELKTPIALIQGYAEGLKEGVNDDSESREFYCEVIMDEAAKMNQMVKNLLTLNQLEFGNDGLSMERFDVVELIKGVIQSSEILMKQKQAKVIFLQKDAVYVWGDEFKVEQVVRNYLNNALNHLEGDLVIEVKIVVTDGKAHITVFNTGQPIPDEDIPKIWDKFYKVDKARTREYGGNGIGLSIVKAIMESFHQKYGVKNYDNGVEFWFELDVK